MRASSRTNMAPDDWHQGDHVFHYVATPTDLSRDRFTMADRLPEHNVLGTIRVYRSGGGTKPHTKFKCDDTPKRPAKPVEPKAPPKRDRSETRKPKPMGRKSTAALKFWDGVTTYDLKSFGELRTNHRRQVNGTALAAFRRDGFHLFLGGAVVWMAEMKMPDFVAKAMRSGGLGLLAKACEMREGLEPCQIPMNEELKRADGRMEA